MDDAETGGKDKAVIDAAKTLSDAAQKALVEAKAVFEAAKKASDDA